ncbi:MAG: hypothetical protein AAB879_01450 [Patescibacteria group bacterium]
MTYSITQAQRLEDYAADSLGSLSASPRESRRPSPHAGKPCCGITSGGTVCGTRISPHNYLKTEFPFCLPCYQVLLETGHGALGPRFVCITLMEDGTLCGRRVSKKSRDHGRVPICLMCINRKHAERRPLQFLRAFARI